VWLVAQHNTNAGSTSWDPITIFQRQVRAFRFRIIHCRSWRATARFDRLAPALDDELVIGDGDIEVLRHLLQLMDRGFGDLHAALTLELERLGHHAPR
jgi:hypothetical protein